MHGIGGCGDCLFIDANPIVQKQVGATVPWDRRVVEAQVALSRSFGCHIFMASGQSAASALQAVLPGPEGRSARVVVPFGGQPVPFILCLDGTGSLDIVVCSEHFSMMHFQPLRGGLVAATAAFSSAMHGPTPGLMARMVATVEYFNEQDASYRSVEARVANTRQALVDLEATMAPLAAAHQQATNAAAAVEDHFRLAQLQALPQVLLHLQGMVPLLQQAMQPVDHLTALSPRRAHRELARKSREEYDKQVTRHAGGAHPQQLQPVAEGLVLNCFTKVMRPSHCGLHYVLNVPPKIVHQHMSHLLGQPFRLRGGGKEWECRLQAYEAPSRSHAQHRLTAWRKCVQHMKLEVNNIVTVKVVTEGSSTILEVTAQRGSAGSGGGAQQQQQQQGDGGAHTQQLQHQHQRAAASPHLRARRVSPAALRGATTYSETSDDELISDTDEEEENGPLVTAPSAGGDDPLALAQPYPQQITSPFASQAWDASARSFGSLHLQGCTQEQLQAALQVASTAYQCQMPALLQLQQQQVLQPSGSAGMRAWGGGAVELGGASLATLHPSTAMHPQGIPDHLQLPVSEGPWAWHEAGPLGYGGVGGSWGGPGSGIGGDTGGVETAAAPSAGADDAMMAMYQQFGQTGASPSASQGLSICEGMGAEENATSMDLEWGPPVPFRPPGDICFVPVCSSGGTAAVQGTNSCQ